MMLDVLAAVAIVAAVFGFAPAPSQPAGRGAVAAPVGATPPKAILTQCLNVIPPGYTGSMTGGIKPIDQWWADNLGVGKREFLYEHKDQPSHYGTNLLLDIGAKKCVGGWGFVCDVEPMDMLAVVPQVTAAIGTVNYATLSASGGSGAAAVPCALYDFPPTGRTPWWWIDIAAGKGRNDQMGPIVAVVESFNLRGSVWLGPDGRPEATSDQVRRLTAHVAECRRLSPTKPIDVVLLVSYLKNNTGPTNPPQWLSDEVTTATFNACDDLGVRSVILYGGSGERLTGTEGWYTAVRRRAAGR